MKQSWRELLFLHWELPAEEVAATLPSGLSLDRFEGKAYVGVVPFWMARVRPVGLPPVPGLSWFGELNLRTYVVGPDGVPGVWFYSLDAHQRIAVWLAKRFFSLPYHFASIGLERTDVEPSDRRRMSYRWQRGGGGLCDGPPNFEYVTPSERGDEALATEPGTLEHFLVERYILYSRRPLVMPSPNRPTMPGGGEIFSGRVEHEPYRVAPVEMHRYDTQLFKLNGLSNPGEGVPPASALWSPGVDVSVYPLRRATR